jgi:hypothetical protein
MDSHDEGGLTVPFEHARGVLGRPSEVKRIHCHVTRPDAGLAGKDQLTDTNACKQCHTFKSCCRCMPCAHVALCAGCAQWVDDCPECAQALTLIEYVTPPSTEETLEAKTTVTVLASPSGTRASSPNPYELIYVGHHEHGQVSHYRHSRSGDVVLLEEATYDPPSSPPREPVSKPPAGQ